MKMKENNCRKNLIFIMLFLLGMCLVSCEKKNKAPEFADDLFVKLSYEPANSDNIEKAYKLNIEIYRDGTVRIYANEFLKWYGKDVPGIQTSTISPDDEKKIEKMIIDEDLYHLQRDVGNKTEMEGIKKTLTVYTKDEEYSVYGINPSNKSFNKVYDLIYELTFENMATYITKIDEIQRKGVENDVGLYIKDNSDNIVFAKEDIKDIYSESEAVVIELNEEKAKELEDMTYYIDEDMILSFSLYNDNEFVIMLVAYHGTTDGKIYVSDSFGNEDEMNEFIQTLKEGLE